MSLKRRVTCPLVRSKSFHLSSTEGKKAPLLNTHKNTHYTLTHKSHLQPSIVFLPLHLSLKHKQQ